MLDMTLTGIVTVDSKYIIKLPWGRWYLPAACQFHRSSFYVSVHGVAVLFSGNIIAYSVKPNCKTSAH